MLLLDNQYTVKIFCNNKIVTRVWRKDDSMIVKVNGGSIKATHKYYVEGYGITSHAMWTNYFLDDQIYKVQETTMYQDTKSEMIFIYDYS